MSKSLMAAALSVAMLAGVAPSASAADFPTKPVTLVIPYGTGGGNDITGRYLADQLSKVWGQPVVVENRPGAGTAIGTAHVAQAAPDGYTLLFVSVTYTTTPAVQPELPYDPAKDLAPIAMFGAVPLAIASGPKTPVTSIQELVEAAKKGPLLYATAGTGSINQFSSELLNTIAGIKTTAVHYKSGGEALTALIGGHVDFYSGSLLQLEPFINDGQVTGLLVTSPERNPSVPNVPTPAEAGLAGAEVDLWWGVFAPGGTPTDIVEKLNADINGVLSTEATKKFLAEGGARQTPMSASDFTAFVQNELTKWRGIAEQTGIKAE